jgi:two-component system, NtrC family, response regulator GlrR
MSQDAVAFLGESRAFRAARERLRRIAKTDATLLIEGETGTGKELAARVVHYEGSRSGGPFIPINCGAIPDALLESELFGYKQGAFTDAKTSAPGILLLAHGGTLFLDEVDSLSARAQVALLRFLQDRVIRPLGSGAERKVDVRIVAATNQNLMGLVEKRLFRHDLYYRLNVMHVELPPLRERDADVELFAAHLLRQFAARYGSPVPQLDEPSRMWLRSHSWPGNVRELENLIESEFLLAEGESPLRLSFLCPCRTPPGSYDLADEGDDAQVDHGKGPSWNYRRAKAQLLEEFDRTFLDRLMRFAGGNVALAARTSGKERRELGRLLRKYGMMADAFRGESRG